MWTSSELCRMGTKQSATWKLCAFWKSLVIELGQYSVMHQTIGKVISRDLWNGQVKETFHSSIMRQDINLTSVNSFEPGMKVLGSKGLELKLRASLTEKHGVDFSKSVSQKQSHTEQVAEAIADETCFLNKTKRLEFHFYTSGDRDQFQAIFR